MKIAMIHTHLISSTGGERQILRLAIELQKRGHKVEIFTNAVDYKTCYPELISQVKINVVHPTFLISKIINFGSQKGLKQSLGRLGMLSIGKAIPNNFDIINCHNLSSNWAAYIAKKRLNIPAIWMCNEPPFWYFLPSYRKSKIIEPLFYNFFDKHTVKSIDKIIVLSKKMQKLVKEIYKRKAIVIRSGLDTKLFQQGNAQRIRKKYSLNNSFLLLNIGAKKGYKRHEDCIKALHLISKKYHNVKLIIIGIIKTDRYKEMAQRLNLDHKILFFSKLKDKELRDFYAACDVFLFPANQSWGLVVTEAMASSKPVIVSNRAGVSEIIKNGHNGLVFSHGRPKKIADLVEKLIRNPNLRSKLGRNAFNTSKALSWKNYTDHMEKIFNSVIKNKILV